MYYALIYVRESVGFIPDLIQKQLKLEEIVNV